MKPKTQRKLRGQPIDPASVPRPVSDPWRIYHNGDYLVIHNAHGHPIASPGGRIPYHRWLLFEALGRPSWSACKWCGYVLAWKTNLHFNSQQVVHVDHLDSNPANNNVENLAPSCMWCNPNRAWAEKHPDFWQKWRRWMKDVPPGFRPNLLDIATDFGIVPFPEKIPQIEPRFQPDDPNDDLSE